MKILLAIGQLGYGRQLSQTPLSECSPTLNPELQLIHFMQILLKSRHSLINSEHLIQVKTLTRHLEMSYLLKRQMAMLCKMEWRQVAWKVLAKKIQLIFSFGRGGPQQQSLISEYKYHKNCVNISTCSYVNIFCSPKNLNNKRCVFRFNRSWTEKILHVFKHSQVITASWY